MPETESGLICLADIPFPPHSPDFPRVVVIDGEPCLEVCEGREYDLNPDPLKFLGLLDHLSAKIQVAKGHPITPDFLNTAIVRVSQHFGWTIHPF